MREDDTHATGVRAAPTALSAAERRSGERRDLSLRTIVLGSMNPRRRAGRRHDDSYHIDWHEPHLLFLSVTILLLSVIDAFMTLTLLPHGSREANPLLGYLLNQHPQMFAVVKMAFTGLGVLVLVAMARAKVFRVIRVRTILHWCLLAYVALIGYEMWLLRGVF
jgi:hypothetical protein